MDLYDYETLFNTRFKMNKGVRLEYGDSVMTHAMLFTGVDIKNNKPTKWRVENSWGNKTGNKGYYLMNDSWFNEYNYEVVIDKKYLSQKIINLFDYEILLNTKFNMNKGVRLEYGDSLMTHAMLFTGVDIKNGKPVKWRVENSWGNKSGDKGYYLMSDSWFNEYNYEVVIDKKYLTQNILNLFNKDPVKLDPWDPMGALAIK